MRMADVDGLVVAATRLEADDADRGMPLEEAHQLAATVPGGTDDADPYLIAHGWRILVP
jgi:hypothetical protein